METGRVDKSDILCSGRDIFSMWMAERETWKTGGTMRAIDSQVCVCCARILAEGLPSGEEQAIPGEYTAQHEAGGGARSCCKELGKINTLARDCIT
jgi:hypothetical protein